MNENDYQPMPHEGKLYDNLNLSREDLLERVAPFQREEVRAYVVTTLDYQEGHLRQWGSAPNFQGSRITLFSCKHYMRTSFPDIESWKGVWVAGYTGSSRKKRRRNRLFYLMRVSLVFDSHHELWFSDCVPEETKRAKAAHLDRFGDIYQPEGKSGDAYSPLRYRRPCKDHVHRASGLWQDDIDYCKGYGGRKPALLVGDPEYSFLWNKPTVPSPCEIPRNQKKLKLSRILAVA